MADSAKPADQMAIAAVSSKKTRFALALKLLSSVKIPLASTTMPTAKNSNEKSQEPSIPFPHFS